MTVTVGFCGAACSGKTTLVNELVDIFEGDFKVKAITDIARKCSMGLSLDEIRSDPILLYQYEKNILGNYILEVENTNYMECDLILTDRTFLDILSYVITYMDYFRLIEFINEFEYVLNLQAAYFDLTVVLSPLDVSDFDPFRSDDDVALQNLHHNLLKTWAKSVPHEIIETKDFGARVEMCSKIIRDLLTDNL